MTRISAKYDARLAGEFGVSWCGADEDAWRRVWTENEQLYYGSAPAFSVEAVK